MSSLGEKLFGNKDHARYFEERRHIWIEKMDLEKNTKAVQSWIEEQPQESKQRLSFVLRHINLTSPVFKWHFKESSFKA